MTIHRHPIQHDVLSILPPSGEIQFRLHQPRRLRPGILFSFANRGGGIIGHVSLGEDRQMRAYRCTEGRWSVIYTNPILDPGTYDVSYFYGSPAEYITLDDATASYSVALGQPLDDGATLLPGYPDDTVPSAADTVEQITTRERSVAQRIPRKRDLIAIMTVKNEAELLPQCLAQLAELCDGVVVLDDGSSDSTPEILRAHPAILKVIRKDASLWQDGPNKLQLVYEAQEFRPDWLLSFDADDLFEKRALQELRRLLNARDDIKVFKFQYCHLWDSLTHYRCDAPYEPPVWARRLWRNEICHYNPLTVRMHSAPHAVHWSPANIRTTDLRIKHFGNATVERRLRRYEWYQKQDPNLEGQLLVGYNHLLQSGEEVKLMPFVE